MVRSVAKPSLRLASCVQRGGGEGRGWTLDARFLLDRGHGPRQVSGDGTDEVGGGRAIEQPDVLALERARLRVEVLPGATR